MKDCGSKTEQELEGSGGMLCALSYILCSLFSLQHFPVPAQSHSHLSLSVEAEHLDALCDARPRTHVPP